MDIPQLKHVIQRYGEELKNAERELEKAKRSIEELEKIKVHAAQLEAKIRSDRQKKSMAERELSKAEFDEVQRKGSVKLH